MVSVVITNFNGRELLKMCLASLGRSTYPNVETIVVDNSSTDGSVAMVRENFPLAIVLVTNRIGLGEAINHGIRKARGDIVADLNNDVVFESGWLEPLVSILESSSDIAIVCGKVLFMSDPSRIYSAGARISYLSGSTPSIGYEEKDRGQYNRPAIVDYVPFPVFKKNLVSEIGYFDPTYYLPFTETDFCLRARNHGFRIVYVPTSIIFHYVGASGRTSLTEVRNYYLFRRNSIRFVLKNFPIWAMPFALLRALVINTIIDTVVFTVQRRAQFMVAQLRAIFWNFSHIRDTLRARLEVIAHTERA